MSNIVSTQAKDGSTVEFNYEDPKQGGVKDVYFAPDKSYVVAFYRKQLDYTGLLRLDKLVGKYREQIFESEGGDYWKDIFCWPEKIVDYNGKTGIVVPAYQPHFFFEAESKKGEEKEGKWFASARNYNRFVPKEEMGGLNTFLRVCLKLAQGVRRLHAAGLAHSDLSYKNCLIDPKSGSACIIDLDGLVVPGLFPPDVFGTADFMAPEVVETLDQPKEKRVLPSRTTDQHALAVLIYQYLFHRHPLRGRKVWDFEDDKRQESLEMGKNALFIEHPTNRENAYDDRDPDEVNALALWSLVNKLSYKSMGPELSELFERAFIEGLHNPALRPTANEWEDALSMTADRFVKCNNPQCIGKGFIYNNAGHPACPYCDTRLSEPLPFLDYYVANPQGRFLREKNRRMVIWHGVRLYQWHADRYVVSNEKTKPEDKEAVAYCVFHNGAWNLVNVNLPELKVVYENGSQVDRKIGIGQKVVLTNGMQMILKSPPNGRAVTVGFTK